MLIRRKKAKASGDNDGLGQSILSQDDSDDEEATGPTEKNIDAEQAASSAAASMGLEVFQFPTPQNGVRIASINEQSKAGESGLRVGDMIVAVDRTRTVAPKEVAAILKKHQPGSSIRVQFVRDNVSYVTNVPLIASEFSRKDVAAKTTQELDNNTATKSDRVAVAKPPTQVIASQKTQTQTDRIKLGMLIQDPASLRGTVVTKVRPDSIADVSGLEEGDRIVSVESRLLESGDQLREIVSKRTWGDQLAMGVVRDGELISRKVKFERSTPESLAASKPIASETKTSASKLGKGLGSMLGGLFGGGTKTKANAKKPNPAVDDSAVDNQVVRAGGTLPQPAESANVDDDPLDFGDGEPIEQVIFQKKTTE